MKYQYLFLLLLAVLAGIYLLAPGLTARGLISLERMAAGLEARSLTVDSLEIHYLEGGAGPTLLMIHGFGADKDNWSRIARAFTDRHHVVAPDLPGFGDSSVPGDMRFDVETQATRLIAFAEKLGLAQIHLLGSSMGGQIATVIAARRPELVASLALFDPLGVEQEPGVRPSTMMRRMADGRNPMLPRDQQSFDEMFELMFFDPPWVPGVITRYYAQVWLSRADLHARVFSDITVNYVALVPLLPAIQAPTLVLWGAEDAILPADGAGILATGIARSTLVVIPECGHLPMLEKPAVTAAHYRAFLDALPGP